MFRLLTLTGVGGVGKTRLATRAAVEMRRAFSDGVRFVDFGALRDPSLVQVTVQTAVGPHKGQDTGENTLDELIRHLRGQQMLIVLDNCEHVLEELPLIVDALLRNCPDLCLIATSRQTLRVEGECSLCVACLPLPDEGQALTASRLLEFDAPRLFVDRAFAALPDFELSADSGAIVEAICRRLDGLPLAIELAAVKLRAFSLVELLERLDNRFALLTGGNRAAVPRQQTLRALIEWSFDLSNSDERLMWARLSIFLGSCSLEAIEGVCSDDRLGKAAVADLIAELVDKSLLVRESHGGVVRYRMLQTIRHFGQEHMIALGEQQALRVRHHRWYAGLVDRETARLFGPDQLSAYARLRLDIQNVCACLDLCIGHPELGVEGLQMASRLLYYWLMSGNPREGYVRLHRLLRNQQWSRADRIQGLTVAAQLAGPVGEVRAGLELIAEAKSILDPDDAAVATAVHVVELMLLIVSGSITRGPEDPLTSMTDLLHSHPPLTIRAQADMLARTTTAAVYMSLSGAYDDALHLCELAQSLSETLGEQWWGSVVRWAHGFVLARQGLRERAVQIERESIALCAPFRDGYMTSMPIQVIASVLGEVGELGRASMLLGAATNLRGNEELAMTRPQSQAVERAARSTLGDSGFDAAFCEGSALSYEDAINLALGFEVTAESHADTPCVFEVYGGYSASELDTLTRREREIAALVVEGLTNRQIANRLVISVRTAEGHVDHILAKLGLRSRTQIASYYAQFAVAKH